SPASGAYVNANRVNLTGGAGNSDTVTVNGQAANVHDGLWSFAGFDLGTDGSHPLTIVGTNAAGSLTLTPLPVIFSDTVPPVIQASLNPAPNAAGWNSADVTVTFTCTDTGTGSGIATCPPQVTLTNSQSNVYRATDTAGNVSDPVAVTVRIDRVKPALT